MMHKYTSAIDLCKLLDQLPTDRIDYREALQRRLLNGAISAYCTAAVVSDAGGNQQLPGASINARVWEHIFAQGGDDLKWPSQDMSTFFHETGDVPCRCDYLGLYFRNEDLADFLPTDTFEVASLDPAKMPPASVIPLGKPKTGRPRSTFWDMMTVEVARRIYTGDIQPPIKANIVRKDLLSWLAYQGEVPDRTTVASFFAELEKALNTEHYSKNTD